jgi:hypothetical protein
VISETTAIYSAVALAIIGYAHSGAARRAGSGSSSQRQSKPRMTRDATVQ